MSDKNLREKLIRLAHAKPELRAKLLPLIKEAGWDWRKDGLRPSMSKYVGQKYKGKVLKTFGKHRSGYPYSIVPRPEYQRALDEAYKVRDWERYERAKKEDPYYKLVIDDKGVVLYDFASVPSVP